MLFLRVVGSWEQENSVEGVPEQRQRYLHLVPVQEEAGRKCEVVIFANVVKHFLVIVEVNERILSEAAEPLLRRLRGFNVQTLDIVRHLLRLGGHVLGGGGLLDPLPRTQRHLNIGVILRLQ